MIEYAVIDNGVDSIANPFGLVKSSVVPTNPLTRICAVYGNERGLT